MKKFNFLKFSLALALLSTAAPMMATAQNMDHFETNWYSEYVGTKVTVNSPSSVARTLVHTIASSAGTPWGGTIPSTGIIDVEVVQANPYDACGTLTNSAAINGKIALVQRNVCEFGAKAKTAQDAGAIAVLIVNNVDGAPIPMGAGAIGSQVTIPVLMITKNDGAALVAAMTGGETVKVTLSTWGNGLAKDLGLVDRGGSFGYASSMPLSQVRNASTVSQYGIVPGAVVGNFGTDPMTNVVLGAKLTWIPDGGSSSVVFDTNTSSNPIATFAPGDSIMTPFIDRVYNLPNVTTTGRFELEYSVSATETDENLADNNSKYTMYVTPNTYSKGAYNAGATKPITGSFFQPLVSGQSIDYVYGPMTYMATGGYNIENVQVSITNGEEDPDLSAFGTLFVIVWKWTDGSNGQPGDGLMQAGEVIKAGVASHTMVAGDTNGMIFTIPVINNADNSKPLVTEANSYYWTSAAMPQNNFIGCDGETNFQPRVFFRNNVTNGATREMFGPIFAGTDATLPDNPAADISPYAFETTTNPDSVRFTQHKSGSLANIPLIMSVFPTSVKNVTATSAANVSIYPNPVVNEMNVSVNLDKEAKNVNYAIFDGVGRKVSEVARVNVKNDVYTLATTNLAAGNYFLVVNIDNKATVKQFSVIK